MLKVFVIGLLSSLVITKPVDSNILTVSDYKVADHYFNPAGDVPDRKLYYDHVSNLMKQNYNAGIKQRREKFIRIATYNVKEYENSENGGNPIDTLKSINADVMIMNEFQPYGGGIDIDQELISMGYVYSYSQRSCCRVKDDAFLCNPRCPKRKDTAIYSKLKLSSLETFELPFGRSLVSASIGNVTVYATHLEYRFSSAGVRVRESQAKSIVEIIPKDSNYVLAGDLNAAPSEPYMKILKNHSMIDSFTAMGRQLPKFSSHTNKLKDYIMVSGSLKSSVRDSRIFYSMHSDHLLVYADFSFEEF
jgi:endonuclease/exonuclease/phosphatase family metal-dependent hydrolase